MTMKTRFVPQGFVRFEPKYIVDGIGGYKKDLFECYVDREKPTAIFYIGKQSTPAWYNRFQDNDSMKKKILEQISNLMSYEDLKAKRREEMKAPHTLKVGDILYTSWGYDQTNVDFYQVTAVVSDRSVKIRQIASKVVSSDGGGCDNVVAIKDAFLSPANEYDKTGIEMLKRANKTNSVNIASYASADMWDGRPMYQTASGWGH